MEGMLYLKQVEDDGKVTCIQSEETNTEDMNFELNKVKNNKAQTVKFDSVHYLNGDIKARFVMKWYGKNKSFIAEFISKKQVK